MAPCVVIIMGVAGSGKTTLSKRLAKALKTQRLLEGDDFHPYANVTKMREGKPLDDKDREPWLIAIREKLLETAPVGSDGIVIVTCSALKKDYRDIVCPKKLYTLWIYLKGDKETLEPRIKNRQEEEQHFFESNLLDNQLKVLEEPTDREMNYRSRTHLAQQDLMTIEINKSPAEEEMWSTSIVSKVVEWAAKRAKGMNKW